MIKLEEPKKPKKLTIKIIGSVKEIYAFLSRLQTLYDPDCMITSKLHKNEEGSDYHLFVNIHAEVE